MIAADDLVVDTPDGVLTDELVERIRGNKTELVALLGGQEAPSVTQAEHPDHEPVHPAPYPCPRCDAIAWRWTQEGSSGFWRCQTCGLEPISDWKPSDGRTEASTPLQVEPAAADQPPETKPNQDLAAGAA